MTNTNTLTYTNLHTNTHTYINIWRLRGDRKYLLIFDKVTTTRNKERENIQGSLWSKIGHFKTWHESKQATRTRTRDEVGRKSCSRRSSEPVPLERGCYTSGLPLRAQHSWTLVAEDLCIYTCNLIARHHQKKEFILQNRSRFPFWIKDFLYFVRSS